MTSEDTQNPSVSETATVQVFLWLAIMFAVFAVTASVLLIVFSAPGPVWIGPIVFIILTAVTFSFARLTVTVDSSGLRVSNFLGLTLKRIRIETVTAVDVIQIAPWEWGGYGLRAGYRMRVDLFTLIFRKGASRTPRFWSLISRKGAGLVIEHGQNSQSVLNLRHAGDAAVILLAESPTSRLE